MWDDTETKGEQVILIHWGWIIVIDFVFIIVGLIGIFLGYLK
jgi:hypothetical protein